MPESRLEKTRAAYRDASPVVMLLTAILREPSEHEARERIEIGSGETTCPRCSAQGDGDSGPAQ